MRLQRKARTDLESLSFRAGRRQMLPSFQEAVVQGRADIPMVLRMGRLVSLGSKVQQLRAPVRVLERTATEMTLERGL